MRQVPGSSRPIAGAALACLIVAVFATDDARAQGYGGYPYPVSYYNNQSVQYGLNLPQVPVSNGSDEIRAADGTTCKSSISGNGPVLDVGLLGNQDFYGSFASGTLYGRVVMPLGEQPKRLDCTGLYKLEIERLQHELKLVRMGMGGKGQGVAEGGGASWQTEGWSGSPRGQKLGGEPPQTAPAQHAGPVPPRNDRITRGGVPQVAPPASAPAPPAPVSSAPPARSETASIGPAWSLGAGSRDADRPATVPVAPSTPMSGMPMPGAIGAAGWVSTVAVDVPPASRTARRARGADWTETFWSVER